MKRHAEKPGAPGRKIVVNRPLLTAIEAMEGELLTYLDTHGSTTMRQLCHDLEWPRGIIWMAIGGLATTELVRVIRRELEVIVEPVRKPEPKRPADESVAPVPEVWGG